MAIQASDLDCRKCGQLEKIVRGCKEEVQAYNIGEIEVTRCPKTMIMPITNIYIRIYNACKNFNCLLNDGALMNQPSKGIDAIRIIEGELIKVSRPKKR